MSLLDDPKAAFADLTRPEWWVLGVSVAFLLFLFVAMLTGGLSPTYFLFLVGLAGMYALLSFGLNAQWGFTGLINFSVAAFFGIGAYGTALMTASGSPIAGGFNPLVGLAVALVVAFVLALLIGIPTLRLRADYLAIASLGLAEVVRLIVLNERWLTNGSAGLRGIPGFFVGWPVLSTFPEAMPGLRLEVVPGSPVFLETPFWQASLNGLLVVAFAGGAYLVLRRAHRSPWGRVLRTIRSDEDLARALGKNTYSFKMQSFVLGSLIMALAGVFYAHLNLYVGPGDLDPITTFYAWVAVILGGSGSNRGALFGGVVIVTIREGTRFLNDVALPIDPAPLRLLLIGVVIVAVMRYRPQGVLPPQRELIWPSAVDGGGTPETPDSGVRERKGGGGDE
ncbi:MULTISPECIES: branched-chain amino acid ABC transporter permease [Halorubrum]|uniref:Amino acid/amide ABC transporter membrane protein 2, HAAT family n=1 Tax=Halorubrum sodomense TaxID=35743 RepID=A0A1I6GT23_HALSD|nr:MULTISPECIES: branched-chain amino acid ABC transporter permease [Halorubrum]TKX55125.1 branched-chain amino acid ABC transporter permease [Halorubrum sp. SP3]TKX70185.1 branched-chain amino acid ABC transporter permease [Halorubrum sp. SP9]SFR45330.1 amino acid/amide ABC transporter membrane protein 2, HAAT family [Halorubrum sodomense]